MHEILAHEKSILLIQDQAWIMPMSGNSGVQSSLEGYGMEFVAAPHIAMLVRSGCEQAGEQAVPARKEGSNYSPEFAVWGPKHGCQQKTAKGFLGMGKAKSATRYPLQGQGQIARVSRSLFQSLQLRH